MNDDELRTSAYSMVNTGRFVEAESALRALIGTVSPVAEDFRVFGLALKGQGREKLGEAILQFAKASDLWAAEKSPDQKFALREWGDALRELGNFSEAAEKYRQALVIDDNDASLHNLLGIALKGQGRDQHEEAIKQFAKASQLWAAEKSTNQKYALRNWADVLRDQERLPEAIAKYGEALQLEGNDASIHNNLGLALKDQGEPHYEDAITQFSKANELWAVERSVNQKYALRNWGDVLREQKRFGDAEAKYRQAVVVDPSDPTTFNSLGLALKDQGREQYEEAIVQFSKASGLWAVEKSLDQKYALRNWADTLRERERFLEAIAKYQEALAIDEGDANSHNNLGLALKAKGRERHEEAIAQFAKASELWAAMKSTDQKYALRNWADVLREQECFAEAEGKYRQALEVDTADVNTYNLLGLALQGQGREQRPAAIAQFAKASELWANAKSADQKYALRNWGQVLLEMEQYDAAVEKFAQALKVDVSDVDSHFDYANALGDAGRHQDALDAYDAAIMRDPKNPYNYHNKAFLLFSSGRYESGWSEWRNARRAYHSILRDPPVLETVIDADRAVYFAWILDEYFSELEYAERLYLAVIAKWPDKVAAHVGLAKLYYRWTQSERPFPSAVSRLSSCVANAQRLLESRLGQGDSWPHYIELADLFIKTEDYAKAKESIDAAKAYSGDSRVRQAEIDNRYGIVHSRRNQPELAAVSFAQALRFKPGDLTLRLYHAEALLKQKDLVRSEAELKKLLAIAPAQIEALIAYAQICIELADGGEVERYGQAEEYLDKAVQLGARSTSGSKRLAGRALADVLYLRGYVKVKRYENDAKFIWSLAYAERDFRACVALDPSNHKARSAMTKVRKQGMSSVRTKLFDWIGTLIVCLPAALIFVFAQWDFFFAGQTFFGIKLSDAGKLKEPGYYVLVTFGALLFMIAGLSLPRLLKLKVGAIELEKGSVDQIKGPVQLGISK